MEFPYILPDMGGTDPDPLPREEPHTTLICERCGTKLPFYVHGMENIPSYLYCTTCGVEVRCNQCHWSGVVGQLKGVYVPNPELPGDVVMEDGCPSCLSHQYLEYKEE